MGLERLVTQLGLDSLWENESGGKKSNTLIVAGKYMALDIQLEDNTVQKVSCTFESSSDLVRAHEHKISEILMNDLRLRPNELPLCRTLDRFAVNLERLALLDGLSERDSLDCFEAVAGIHESLERLHAWDMGKLRQDPSLAGASESVLLNTALATRHGHPGMHTRGRVGLSLDYWKDRWMEPPQPQSGPDVESWAKENEATWAILVGCARAGEYQRPIRVSDNWLAPNVEVADPTSADLLSVSAADRSTGPMLDWQEPEERVISPKGDKMGNGSGLDGMDADDPLAVPKLPEVVFTATFDPPVIVPINVWANIHSLVDATSDFQTVTFDNLLFPVSPGSAYNPSEMTRTIEHTREVRVFSSDGKKATKVHKNTLFIFKPVYGRSLAQLPFAHPRQLIAMLPYLRQCAFLATLLKRSFGKKSDEAKAPEGKSQAAARANGMVDEPVDLEVKPLSEDFTGFLDSSLGGSHDGSDARGKSKTARRLPGETDASGSGDALRIDVTLMAHPTPRLEVVFPFRRRTANILLEVALDGRLLVVSQNVVLPEPGTAGQSAVLGGAAASRAALASGGGSGGAAAVDEEMDEPGSSSKGKGKLVSPKKLAELLESCMDLDMWCEWIKTRLE